MRIFYRELFTRLLALGMALVVPSVAAADLPTGQAGLVNTASISYRDNLGTDRTGTSNTVMVTVNLPPSGPPSAPTLNLPRYLATNAQIAASYSGNVPASYFAWSFTPVDSIPGGVISGAKAVAQAQAANFTTPTPQANLGSVTLGLGPYLVSVKVYNSSNQASAAAQAYVTLVPPNLSGVRAYPNPWRSDRHSAKTITFDQLTVNTTIKIFTVSGHLVKTLPTANSSASWALTNDSGDQVASGLYLYLMTTDQGQKQTGKIVVIK